jgi:hypothetical protein
MRNLALFPGFDAGVADGCVLARDVRAEVGAMKLFPAVVRNMLPYCDPLSSYWICSPFTGH